ncbi:uncharacterized protein LOC131852130 [Achroia grisella]|uniref:uncharacterized protein LOC131852130 n=1 Tax=Achroia grisella TaxID=688607 RepID=UPI0027D2EEAA|nr:uncharacterized protein LOC131852130 [Achroia grisella]
MQKKVLNNFIEDKLIEHSQALEHLLRIVENNEELIKQLVKNFTTTVDKPKLPEKVEVPKPTRRNNGDEEMVDNIIFRYGKKIPIYGTLFKNVILKNFDDRTDPMPLLLFFQFMSRRSMQSKPVITSSLSMNNDAINAWCEVALLCQKRFNPVCGYDDNFGYAKFDDICHMFQVNCYWKHNFALVPNCRPFI